MVAAVTGPKMTPHPKATSSPPTDGIRASSKAPAIFEGALSPSIGMRQVIFGARGSLPLCDSPPHPRVEPAKPYPPRMDRSSESHRTHRLCEHAVGGMVDRFGTRGHTSGAITRGIRGAAMSTDPSDLALPRRPRGRPSAAVNERYRDELEAWCAGIQEIADDLDFKVSSRGWCYILEEHGLAKGDFDTAQRLINECRKDGYLPLDLCCEDEGRAAANLQEITHETPDEFAQGWIDYLDRAHEQYVPIAFWDDLPVYIEITVEKVDLKSLFSPVCQEFHIPITNISGWSDINARAAMTAPSAGTRTISSSSALGSTMTSLRSTA